MQLKNKKCIQKLSPSVVGFLLIAICAVLNPANHFLCALVLLIGAIVGYFYIVLVLSERNWMDIRAVFYAVWFTTLSLASLRLNNYQKEWESITWILSAAGFASFQLGALFGISFGNRKISSVASRIKETFRFVFFAFLSTFGSRGIFLAFPTMFLHIGISIQNFMFSLLRLRSFPVFAIIV